MLTSYISITEKIQSSVFPLLHCNRLNVKVRRFMKKVIDLKKKKTTGKFTLKQEMVQNSQALCFTMYNKNRPQLWPPLEGLRPVKQLKKLRAQFDDARICTSFYFLYPICVVSGHPPGGQPRPSHLSWEGFLVRSVSETKRFWRGQAWWYVVICASNRNIWEDHECEAGLGYRDGPCLENKQDSF